MIPDDLVVEVWQSSATFQWHWHAKAPNGEIVSQGEAHTRKWSAKRAARRLFPHARIVVLKK